MTTEGKPITGAALLRWIELELPGAPWPEREPFVGFVYLDAQAGLSAKGGRRGDPGQRERPSMTLRAPLPGRGRVLGAEEAKQAGLPERPSWLQHYGAQPPADGPWRSDPALEGRFHASWPDDLQVLVHDGEPRRSGRAPELCWVRVVAAEDGPVRPRLPAGAAPLRGRVYVADLLNQPHGLQSIRAGQRLRILGDAGGETPLMVTADYLADRPGWQIEACSKCGLAEGLDPPAVMARTRFPDVDATPVAFTAHCPLCGGLQMLQRNDEPA